MNSRLQTHSLTISDAIQSYLDSVTQARSLNTSRTYHAALERFILLLEAHELPPATTSIEQLNENPIAWFTADLKAYAPATERLYLTAVTGFYEFLAAESLTQPNLPRIQLLIRNRARRPGQRLPQFPREAIEKVLIYAINLALPPTENDEERLRNLRDRAFIVTLADTGLRVHEACGLRRGDIDWNEARAIIIGKGNRQAVVRFSERSLSVLRDYLNARKSLDGAFGKPLASLPVFARHDRGAGKKVKPITTTTGRNIVDGRVREALGDDDGANSITPHSFRHYFVTTVLRASNNLKLAQELARHRNIAITQRYAHLSDDELDRGYGDIFNEANRH
jgi:site-specific recombinase XerD